MRIESINETVKFAYLPSLEPIWGVLSLLMGEPTHTLCTDIYGIEQIHIWKRKYSFLFESYKAIEKAASTNIIDFLLDVPVEDITLDCFQKSILAIPSIEFLWRIMDLDYKKEASMEILERAFTDDVALDIAYSWLEDQCESFLAFAAFVRQSKRFLWEFFALAYEMDNQDLHQILLSLDDKVERMLNVTRAGIMEKGAFAFSEFKMGKTFRNRGPYAEFVFLPAYLMPYKACRSFHVKEDYKRQFLFMTLRTSYHTQADTIKALKSIADSTRYQILVLIAKRGTMRGFEIAKELSIATSTLSHHMEQLKESGLITEEPVKNSKYYGLNKQTARELVAEISKDFSIHNSPPIA